MAMHEHYVLPSHPSVFSLDPLGICENDNPTAWEVIVTSIQSFRAQAAQSIHQLPSLIQDLSYSIKLDGKLDTGFLSRFLLRKYSDVPGVLATTTLDHILDAALSLPTLFPGDTIQYLGEDNRSCRLSYSKITALLAHQILNTLSPPVGNTWGCTFSCWYSEPQPLEQAVFGYLTALFDFFTISDSDLVEITYLYRTIPLDMNSNLGGCTDINAFDNLVIEPTSTRTIAFPHSSVPCTLIASNQSPGFGAACTQEELVTAACPPLLPLGSLFISPPVPMDVAVVAHGYVPLSHWQGQGREAFCLERFTTAQHTFLLVDAAELDQSNGELPDLEPSCLVRDLHKLYTGFSVLAELGVKNIASPIWGAGSFEGNPIVKTILLSLAASRAGITLHLSVDRERDFVTRPNSTMNLLFVLEKLQCIGKDFSTGDVIQRLIQSQQAECRNTSQLLGIFNI